MIICILSSKYRLQVDSDVRSFKIKKGFLFIISKELHIGGIDVCHSACSVRICCLINREMCCLELPYTHMGCIIGLVTEFN